MSYRLHAGPGQRLAIRVDERTLLAVPPMPEGIPSAVRVKVFEYILRRQPGLAQVTAQIAIEAVRNREELLPGLGLMIAEAPYDTTKAAA